MHRAANKACGDNQRTEGMTEAEEQIVLGGLVSGGCRPRTNTKTSWQGLAWKRVLVVSFAAGVLQDLCHNSWRAVAAVEKLLEVPALCVADGCFSCSRRRTGPAKQ